MISNWGDDSTSFFYSITPDKVLSAVEKLGFICTGRILTLNSMENRVYEVELDANPNELIIVKFYRPGRWTKQQILEEHEFLFDLAAQEIDVIAPRKIQSESLFCDEATGIFYTIFPKARGRNPQELNDEELMQVGRLIARMHQVGSVKKMQHRLELTPESYLLTNLQTVLNSSYLPLELEKSYTTKVETIYKIVQALFKNKNYIRIHGDAHLGNLLWFDSVAAWVDFDDCLMGPEIQDLWLIAGGRDPESKIRLDLLLEGYQVFRPFDRSSIKLIEPLRTMRIVHFNAWLSKRWSDPAFPRVFPQFGTQHYWSEQLAILDEQLNYLQTLS